MLDLKDLVSRTDYYSNEFKKRESLDYYNQFLNDYNNLKDKFSIEALEILSQNTPVYDINKLNQDNILFSFLFNYLLLPNITCDNVPSANYHEEYCNEVIKEYIVWKDINGLLPYDTFLKKFKLFSSIINEEIWHIALPYLFWIISKINNALLFYMLSKVQYSWYDWVSVPSLISSKSMFNTWAFPKYIDNAITIEWLDLVLSPTSEIQLTNLIKYLSLLWHEKNEKVYRFSAHSKCFRMEDKKPDIMWNFYEFEKVELFTVCDEDLVEMEYKKMMNTIEEQLIELWLTYRILLLGDNDMWIASQITHDFEVYYPISDNWVEVSSCSIHWDFASRRMSTQINWKFYHTLHWSALAIPRIIWCIVEQYQDNWEEIVIPEILEKYIF